MLKVIGAQVEAIRSHEPGTRLGHDPEELHQMRTAVRRLRAILRAVRAMFEPAWLDSLRAELQWLGRALGDVRDLDVLRHHLEVELASLAPGEREGGQSLLDRVDAERDSARGALMAALDSPRCLQLLDRLAEAVQHPSVVTADLSLPAIAADEFKKLRKTVEALPRAPSSRALHAARIKVKRARYAAELAQEVVGRPAERFAERAKTLQDILGEHQDSVVAEERLRAFFGGARHLPPGSLLAWLVKRQRARRQAARAAFLEQWPKLEHRGAKVWE